MLWGSPEKLRVLIDLLDPSGCMVLQMHSESVASCVVFAEGIPATSYGGCLHYNLPILKNIKYLGIVRLK